MKRIFSLIITVIAGILLVSCGASSEEDGTAEAESSIPVRVQSLERQSFVDYGEYYGEVKAVREARLVSALGGRVTDMHVEVGDAVEAGRSLARIDADEAESRYETAQLQEQIARDAYEREERFLEIGNSSPVAVDNAHLSWLQARTQLFEAEKARDGALAISPIDGHVISKHIDLYDELSPGAPTFTVADTSQMKVTVGIPESDMTNIEDVGEAEIRVNRIPNRMWEGRPNSIARKRSEHSRTFEIEILVDNPDGELLSGSTAKVRLALRELPDQIVVPSEVVQNRRDESFVMIANSQTARHVTVATGPSNDTHTVITSGLETGDELIVEGINRVADGSTVRVLE